MKSVFTSVSEDKDAIKHFSGILYTTESDIIERDKHIFIIHSKLIAQLRQIIQTSKREDRVTASRAFQLATRSKEAIIRWQFYLQKIEKKDRINWCFEHIQKYFQRF